MREANTGDGDLANLNGSLLSEIRGLIEGARGRVAQAVNTELVLLYWHIGDRIHMDILRQGRANYGKHVISDLAAALTSEYGRGFDRFSLSRMVQFADRFPNVEIVATLWQQLSWSHWRLIIAIDDPLKREFYAQMCRIERWSVRTLQSKIQGMLFERTALSKKPEELARQELAILSTQDQLTPDLVFRDPYFLDFLGLADTYSERDLETAILREMERFLLELGAGFAFVARQKRISIGKKDYYLDLLFYHRGLKRLVAVELKQGAFEAAHKGQMELYLRWLDKHERQEGEEAPIGLILCAEKDHEVIELLQLDAGEIRVAEYLTSILPRTLLEQKLRRMVEAAQVVQNFGEGENNLPNVGQPDTGWEGSSV
ncbi:MAG: PDDEXK nuclease domain-containing protein [Capsulimonadaceae bacterium]